MPKAEILRLGLLPSSLNLGQVARTVNRVQNYFECILADPINHLGQPGANGEYKVTDLARLLEDRRGRDRVEVAIGVTDAPLYWELFSAVDRESKNIVISTAPVEILLSRINQSFAAYVLTELAAQLLTIEYRRQTGLSVEPEDRALPWHAETKSCLFDYCDNPPDTLKKLIAPKLCPICTAVLESANVRESVTAACLSLVKEAVRPRFLTVLRGVLGDPIGRFIFGGLCSLLFVEFLSPLGFNRLQVGLLISAVLMVVVWKHLRRSRKNVL